MFFGIDEHSLPDSAQLDDDERAAVYRAVMRERGGWRQWIIAFTLMVGVITIVTVGRVFGFRALGLSARTPTWLEVVIGIIISVVLAIVTERIMQGRLRRLAWKELAARGYAVCAACGYSLVGIESEKCPECGEAFDMAAITAARARPDA